MKHILVNGEHPELFRMIEFMGKTIKNFKIHYEGSLRKREVLEILFEDGTSMFVKQEA